ncbi:MAG: fibronectin type III domain-containing protein [Akkermansiaceae bacterium]|nr:fibronectin type III domain-containing protein [Akkermansiaceae bacterium]
MHRKNRSRLRHAKLGALLVLIAGILPLSAQLGVRPESAASGDIVILEWNASTGGTTLKWNDDLSNPAGWQNAPGPTPGDNGQWEAQFTVTPPKSFFRLEPAGPPVAPPNLRMIVRDGVFRLEWDSTPDAAEYTVYVGPDPGVGPGNHLASFTLPLTNCFEVVGLAAGQKYFVTIVGSNAAGTGPPAPPVEGVFGPVGVVSGRAVQTFTSSVGDSFDVIGEGAVVSLRKRNDPVAIPFEGIADDRGNFRIPEVPVGIYDVSYLFNGRVGFSPAQLDVGPEGAVLSPLVLATGQQPPQPATTLLGAVCHSNGTPARVDLPEFGISERVEVQVSFAGGTGAVVHPDRHGAFALTDIQPDYPITLTATFKQLEAVAVIQQPPGDLDPVRFHFVERIPRPHRIRAYQNGQEVRCIAPGIPVTYVAEVDNPDGLAEDPHWIAEFNGQKQLSTDPSPTFVFDQPPGPPGQGLGDAQDSGTARVRLLPTCLSLLDLPSFDLPVEPLLWNPNCWSGVACVWDPAQPEDLVSADPATITVTRTGASSPLNSATSQPNGYFEVFTHPSTKAPYTVRVDKPGHMPFLWPFEFQLPLEADFCVVPAQTYNADQDGVGGITINHPSGAVLRLPNGSVLDGGSPYAGTVIIEMVYLAMKSRHPMPPNAEVRDGGSRAGISAEGAVWFSLRKPLGGVLTTTPAATLTIPTTTAVSDPTLSGYHQDETTAYFERWGYGLGKFANMVGTGLYEIPLGTEGLFMIGEDKILNELIIEADRSLNYPFDVLIDFSIFPVTIHGFCQNSLGHLYVPRDIGHLVRVLDLRLAPGRRFTDPTNPATLIPPFTKEYVYIKSVLPLAGPAVPPAIAPHWHQVSLAQNAPELKTLPSDTTVTAITAFDHFLSKPALNIPVDPSDYYQQIQAPGTLAEWRALNGLPARFGAPMPSVPASDYATAYYYNLGDLGFARAQTMRIRTSSFDGLPDVAFAVTNYKTLEDARCGRGAVATVAMDYAARADKGKFKKTRYTRFYVYGSNGNLIDGANLDGGGLKFVPNLCVVCHGGNGFQAGDSPDLGSRFLPFDLESYSFHPKFGVQQNELAKMNAGVLKTDPTVAVQDVIEGWYGAPDPLTNPLNFMQSYIPSGWSSNPTVYSDMFKGACRVCHISRESTGIAQFYTLADFALFGYGHYNACTSLNMPHAQRTWSVFWGSRAAANLGFLIPDMPANLGTAAGSPCK